MKIVRRQLAGDPARLFPGLHPLLARIYAGRGVTDADTLDTGLERLLAVDRLGAIEQAAEHLHDALESERRIVVVGDYDADGATGTAVAIRALRAFGAAEPEFLVPNRLITGYGLTPPIAEQAARLGGELLLTIDNGISSIDGVACANALGLEVIVTDHHLPGDRLPDARAIVNPNLPGDPFPSKGLAGVGVVFYLMVALRRRLRDCGWFGRRGLAEPNLAELLDLVALGTVADLVPLDANNRVLVEQGLRRIRAGRGAPGVRALLDVGGRDPSETVASDLAFAVGPRLNAAGRIDDMAIGIRALLCDDPAAAVRSARQLDALNRERREIEAQMRGEAEGRLDALERRLGGELPPTLVLYDPDWHPGVIGILASRVRERWQRPAVIFADAGDGVLRGSARSIPGFHLRDVLEAIVTLAPGLLIGFGGHAMAAGMTLRPESVDDFRRALAREFVTRLGPQPPVEPLFSDGPLAPAQMDLETACLLRYAGPWGQGFPEPMFDGRFDVVSRRVVGADHLKLLLRAVPDATPIDAIAFRQAGHRDAAADRIHAAFRLTPNRYNGSERVQLIIEDFEERP